MKIKNKIYLPIILFFVLTVCFIWNYKASNSAMTDISEENFIKSIESISPTMRSCYVYIDSLDYMMEQTKPNLIIRCKVTSRGQSDVISPIYTAKDLDYNKYASAYIATPYEIEILEVYYRNHINEVGDTIVINAPYGIVNGIEKRKAHHPIFKVDDEYILFLRVDEIYGNLDYYLAFTPASCLTVNSKDGIFEYGDFATEAIYSKYENNLNVFISDLKNLINLNSDKYNSVIESYGSAEIE